jgi:hypothetical protein
LHQVIRFDLGWSHNRCEAPKRRIELVDEHSSIVSDARTLFLSHEPLQVLSILKTPQRADL